GSHFTSTEAMRARSAAETCGLAAMPRSASASTTAPISSASHIGRCAIFRSPAQFGLLPSTTTSLLSTSTPEEMLARGDRGCRARHRHAVAFHLHEMHVVWIFNARIGDRPTHGGCDALDMRSPADILGRDRSAEGGADRQRRGKCPPGRRGLADAEHVVMRAHDTLGAAGQHARDFTNELCGRLVQMLREQAHQGLGEIAAGEIVDATIAFGLPYDGGDLGGANLSARDQAIELGQVARMGHRQPEDLRPFHVLLPSWLACWISSNTRLGLR